LAGAETLAAAFGFFVAARLALRAVFFLPAARFFAGFSFFFGFRAAFLAAFFFFFAIASPSSATRRL
jgi:hypothetical protein